VSRYRKILTRLWGDERFQGLSRPQPNGQTLWLYLLTGPHTTAIPGLFAAGESGLTEALDWPLRAFRKAWREIEQAGMARADWRARVVWIPKAIHYNEPENPSVVSAWATQLREVPECDLTREAAASIAAYLTPKGPSWVTAWATPCPTPLAQGAGHQEQEQEEASSEQEQNVSRRSHPHGHPVRHNGPRPTPDNQHPNRYWDETPESTQ
jgi:hypothetical protein